ncbi:cytochrome P450 [Streptomyces sp. NPDC052236]|uniref:cytochrome P450 n=1 Tax=Streptomyces sp. NPDC052236 TaxID=3365686 RepID=UPI0037CF87FB
MTTSGITRAPGALPAVGHMLRLLRDPLDFLTSLPRHGDLVRIELGRVPAIVVCAPELTQQVLVDDHTFDKGGPLFDRLREEVLKDGLVSCPHSRHRHYRRLIQPTFHPARLPGYALTMTRQTAALANVWHDGEIIDVLAELVTLTSRILVEAMFSDALPPRKLQQAIDDLATINRRLYRRAVMPALMNRIPTSGNRQYRRALSSLQQTVGNVIDDRRASRSDRGDLISALLGNSSDAEKDLGQGLSDAQIADHVLNFFIAGSETTSNALAWAVLLLGQHPQVQARVHAEADSVLAGSPATLEHLPRLELVNRVVSETLRMYPPAWMLTRTVTTDTKLGGELLLSGTAVIISPYLIHHRRDIHDAPDLFDPDRWASTATAGTTHHSFIPFGAGARQCIGDQFGLVEAALVLATLFAQWHFEPMPGEHLRPSVAFTLPPKGTRMRVTAR